MVYNNIIENIIKSKGITSLSQSLYRIPDLESLSLRSIFIILVNEICDDGVLSLSNNLKYITRLTQLNICSIIK